MYPTGQTAFEYHWETVAKELEEKIPITSKGRAQELANNMCFLI